MGFGPVTYACKPNVKSDVGRIQFLAPCKFKQTEKKNNNVTKENKILPISIFCAHYSQQMGFFMLSERYLGCYPSAYSCAQLKFVWKLYT